MVDKRGEHTETMTLGDRRSGQGISQRVNAKNLRNAEKS